MKILLTSFAILLALYSTLTVAETDEHLINPANVLGVVISDWNDDGGMDRAVLVAPGPDEDDAGLYIYLEGDANDSKLAIYKPNLVWSGGMWGSTPSIGLTKAGSLQVLSQNQAIGRNRWMQKLTIAYRNGQFIVAGYTFDSYDTLEPNSGLSCDVNLLTGKGIKDEKAFKIARQTIKLAGWSDQFIPKQCQE